MRLVTTIAAALIAVAGSVSAQDVWITPETPFIEVEIGDKFIVIERNQDNNAVLTGAFAKTSRPCPSFCIQPMTAAEGVVTVGELEVLTFIKDVAGTGNGFVIDSRTAEFYAAGTIPGAVNLPFNMFVLSDENPFIESILTQLGGAPLGDGSWDFSAATTLLIFCNGPWCDQSPTAISNLINIGYPPEKLLYYRGGMQNWLMMGLTTIVP